VRHMERQLTAAIPTGQPKTVRSRTDRLTVVMRKWSHGGQPLLRRRCGVAGEDWGDDR